MCMVLLGIHPDDAELDDRGSCWMKVSGVLWSGKGGCCWRDRTGLLLAQGRWRSMSFRRKFSAQQIEIAREAPYAIYGPQQRGGSRIRWIW